LTSPPDSRHRDGVREPDKTAAGGQASVPSAVPRTGLRWYNLVIECTDPRRLADFWLGVLGWHEAYATGDEIGIEAPNDPGDRIPAMVFWRTSNPRRGKNRLHVDLRAEDLAAEVDRLIALGASPADVGQPRT
jgi:hypothetical protein